jgi:hypothetical protein
VRNLIVQSHEANITVSGVSRGRPSSCGAQLSRLEVKHSQHWPSKGKQRRRFCSLNKKTRSNLYYCKSVMLVCVSWTASRRGVSWTASRRGIRAGVRVWALNGANGVITNCEVTQYTLAYSLNKSLLYMVWLFFKKSTCLKFQEKTRGKSFGISKYIKQRWYFAFHDKIITEYFHL